jgi:hypothetical protein
MEDWTRGTGTPPVVKGLIWLIDGSKMEGGDWRLWAICGKKAQFSLGRDVTVFQAEIYTILVSAHEIQFQGRPDKHVSICSDRRL